MMMAHQTSIKAFPGTWGMGITVDGYDVAVISDWSRSDSCVYYWSSHPRGWCNTKCLVSDYGGSCSSALLEILKSVLVETPNDNLENLLSSSFFVSARD